MRWNLIARGLLGALGAGLACLLLAPHRLSAFTVGTHVLGLDQRDVRVFNNFLDASANDNTTPHGNWPISTGATLAIRKAVTEWGSRLYGNGSGDPSQPGDLGSGGANFDLSWQGFAPDVGGSSENVVSAASNLGGGVIAVTEAGSSGWRIRLNDSFTWDDGPGDPIAGALDIQAVVTHEFGHALGLLDSNVAGATMSSSLLGNGVPARSLEADDQAGVQFLYGAASPSKPRIDRLEGSGLFEIVGANFAPSGNEVWFTFAVVNATGEPLKVTGLIATQGGTRILVGAPAVSGSGDILVKVPGSGFHTLSNAFPYDETCSTPITVYCTAKTNSLGCAGAIFADGSASPTTGSVFTLGATGLLNQQPGLLIYSTSGPAATPFQGGFLCLQPPVARTGVQSSGGSPPSTSDCSGAFGMDFNAWITSGSDPALIPGTSVFAQYWSRDPGFPPPSNSNLTNALAFMICN